MIEINKIYQTDAFELLKQIDDKSIDCICIDPPYNITACEWDCKIDLNKLFIELKRIIKDNGNIIIFSAQPFTTDVINAGRDIFKQELIWEKESLTNIFSTKYQHGRIHENIL